MIENTNDCLAAEFSRYLWSWAEMSSEGSALAKLVHWADLTHFFVEVSSKYLSYPTLDGMHLRRTEDKKYYESALYRGMG